MRISKSVMAVCGVVVAAVLIGFTNPKTVRAAVTALLVQVTNTPSNPVVNSDVTRSASQLVQLYCNAYTSSQCEKVEPGGVIDSAQYLVPAGQTLVITDISIDSSSSSGTTVVGLVPTGVFSQIWYWTVPNDGTTHHFQLQSGFAWPSGQPLELNASHTTVLMQGYLTAN